MSEEPLAVFIRYADQLERIHQDRNTPAYSETCMCGANVVVGRETSRADLRRIHANFLGRHRACSESATPQADADDGEGGGGIGGGT